MTPDPFLLPGVQHTSMARHFEAFSYQYSALSEFSSGDPHFLPRYGALRTPPRAIGPAVHRARHNAQAGPSREQAPQTEKAPRGAFSFPFSADVAEKSAVRYFAIPIASRTGSSAMTVDSISAANSSGD